MFGPKAILNCPSSIEYRLCYYQVAENRCWSCGLTCQSKQDLRGHLHEPLSLEDVKPLWDSEAYLKPFLQDDSLLYSFNEDEDIAEKDDDDDELIMTIVKNCGDIHIDPEIHGDREDVASPSDNHLDVGTSSRENGINWSDDKKLRAYFPNRAAKDVKNANEDYFGSYSSFGIHREMLSDKVFYV